MTTRIQLILKFLLLLMAFTSVRAGVYVQDNANLLLETTRESVELLSHELQVELGIVFLIRTEKKESLNSFEENARVAFSEFIRRVPGDRGVLIYLQVDEVGVSGKINFASGFGLKGALDEIRVREIIRQKILQFTENISEQDGLVEGISELFEQLRQYHGESQMGLEESPMVSNGLGISRNHLFKILIFLFVAFVIVGIWYAISKSKCPRCGSKIHVSIRPLYKSESPYKRIKIIKCFDCNYFRKYLF